MESTNRILPSADFREELSRRGGSAAVRCYQCATCSSVCQLAPDDAPFPRRQMLLAQWGLGERLAADPAVWLCHYCNDCTVRCPRDARPGEVMQAVRALTVEMLSTPRFMGRLVGKAAVSWPLLLGVPLLFWIAAVYGVNGLTIPEAPLVYARFVPHWLIYAVNFPVTGLVLVATMISALRFWKLLGQGAERSGSFVSGIVPVLIDIATHNRFAKCEAARPRRWGHFLLMWGFATAAVATALVVMAMYLMGEELPLALSHPFKMVGNLAAILLVVGGVMLLLNRMQEGNPAGATTSFDAFFLAVVLLVVVTGVLTEVGRLVFEPAIACWIYLVHLGAVSCLFITFPYSKFAHMVYRALAMAHERAATPKKD